MSINIENVFEAQVEILQRNQSKYYLGDPIYIDPAYFNPKYFDNDIRKCEEHSILFDKLKRIQSPVLYWFTIDKDKISAKHIRDSYFKFLKEFTSRNCSSYKSSYDSNSITLYVGKVKTGFWGRFITHLGYSTSPRTAGLQLYHWFNPTDFSNLTLNYIVFDKEMSNLITVFEMEIAQQLKPILGKY